MGRRVAGLSVSEKAEICELYLAGDAVAEIAAAYDLTGGTVSVIAKIAGLPPRQRRSARALEMASCDPEKLRVEDFEGEPRVVDTDLGAALGYERPRAVRQLIERLVEPLRELGRLPQRVATSHEGLGARSVDAYLLNQAQVNFLITRCGLPRADEWCVHIARVFTAWQQGQLQATSYEMAVVLEDGREVAAAAVPDLAGLSDEFCREILERANRGAHEGARAAVFEAFREYGLGNKRGGATEDTKRQHAETCERRFARMCPCCGERRVIDENGKIIGHIDHWTDDRSKNGVHQTWLISAECNQDFEKKRKLRHQYADAFHVYQKRREDCRFPLLSR